jgi:shikimate dehydrogenase
LSAATRVAGVIGEPVEHSLSPVLHNAAFAAMGLDWVYVAFPVAAGQVPEALAGMRALSVAALSVTMPHKAAVAAAMDRLSPTAARLGAVNTVVRRGRELFGDSTDGAGLVAALRADAGWDPARRRCVVLGAGGAARAVIVALAEAGAASVSVVARRPDAAAAAAALAGAAGEVGSVDAVDGADLVVNATPVGMTGAPAGGPATLVVPFGLDPARLGPGQLVVDLIYSPQSTPLLDAARRAGAGATNGLGTLIHQAGAQLRLWTGGNPPLAVMAAAASAALGARGTADS